MTLAEENYLKIIFHLQKEENEVISTNAIATSIASKPSSVTDMVKKLAEKNVLVYKKYKGVCLTLEGKKIAANIIRKHRLWEVFLVDKLNFQWDEVHEIAEQLEHIKSPQLIERLDAFLNFPEVDPHGDPIPTKEGLIKDTKKILLSQINPFEKGICVGVKETSTSFLQHLDKIPITIGTIIEVISKEDFDGSLQVQIGDSKTFISERVAGNIYVKKL